MNYLEKLLLIMIIILVRKKLIGMCIPDTPCPSIFLYKYQRNIWYGELKILVPDLNAKNVKLEVAYFSRVKITNNIENSLNTLNTDQEFASNIENGRPITFILSFPFPNDPPRISDIKLNGNTICSGTFDDEAVVKARVQKNVVVKKSFETIRVGLNGKPISNVPPIRSPQHNQQLLQEQQQLQQQQQQQQQQLLQQQQQQLLQQQQQQRKQQQQQQQQQQQNDINENRVFIPTDKTNVCGTESKDPVALHLIVNGEDADKQPWLVALFDNDAQRPKFFCAGSLISTRFVVTAAHCTISKTYILIKLGGKDVSSISEPEGTIRISELIINHPEYRSQSSNADIAIVKMSDAVSFDNNIKPICLWPNVFLEEERIIDRRAVIFGWGNDAYGHLTLNAPKKTNLIIKSYAECKKMNLLDNIISDKTICATSVNSISGPCLGDSGGGLYIQVNYKWTIRGIISAAIGKETSRTCDVENYFSVYTDTGKYFEWINNIVQTV